MRTDRRHRRVLVIDDAAATRERLCGLLEEDGLDVVASAAEPELVLERFEVHRPSCIVIDVPLRDAQGFEVLTALRARGPGCLLIVIMNNLSEEIRRRCKAARVQHCLEKSREFERVVELVRTDGAQPKSPPTGTRILLLVEDNPGVGGPRAADPQRSLAGGGLRAPRARPAAAHRLRYPEVKGLEDHLLEIKRDDECKRVREMFRGEERA